MTNQAQDRRNRNARGLATATLIEKQAVRLAADHGAAAVTVDQICAAVGISQRTFFNHFATKDDALLGMDLPRVNEQRAREYLADPRAGILTGALGLIELPVEHVQDPEIALARFVVLTKSPALAERQAARFIPIAQEVEGLVYLKLRAVAPSGIEDEQLHSAAATITSIAAALMTRIVTGPDAPNIPPTDPRTALEELQWVWPILLGQTAPTDTSD